MCSTQCSRTLEPLGGVRSRTIARPSRASSSRLPDNFHDLAAGLGQPDAARPDDWVEATTSSSSTDGWGGYPMDVQALLNA